MFGRSNRIAYDGQMGPEHFGWFAAPQFAHRTGEPLRLAALLPECGVCDLATRALDQARMEWTEVFLGGSSAVDAAVAAGLATSVLSVDWPQLAQWTSASGSACRRCRHPRSSFTPR
jgi:hypothetical protein